VSFPEAYGALERPVAREALEVLRPLLLAPIVDHSLRTCLLADAERRTRGWDVDPDELVVACLFHDSGTIPDASPERFEVVGADRAVAFARECGRDAASCRAIWDAVALHTSPGIAERHEPLTRAVRNGVLTDFGAPALVERHRALVEGIEQRYPRAGIERVLARAVVEAARRTPSKAPASSWPAALVHGSELNDDPEADNPCF
jgi:HD domain